MKRRRLDAWPWGLLAALVAAAGTAFAAWSTERAGLYAVAAATAIVGIGLEAIRTRLQERDIAAPVWIAASGLIMLLVGTVVGDEPRTPEGGVVLPSRDTALAMGGLMFVIGAASAVFRVLRGR